jgi:hypothetical protein
MPKTLQYLIKASGNTGSAGQTFRNHVAGATTGAKMSDYVVGYMLGAGYEGYEFDPVPSDHTFPLAFDFYNQGSRFHLIQRNELSAYTFGVTNIVGALDPPQLMASDFIVTNTRHNISLRIIAPPTGAATVYAVAYHIGGPPNGDIPWPVQLDADTQTTGGGTNYSFNLTVQNVPDRGPFNSAMTNGAGWPFVQTLRAWQPSDLDYRWWRVVHNGTQWVKDTNNIYAYTKSPPASTGTFFNDAHQPQSNSEGTDSNAPWVRAWLEWKYKTQENWIVVGEVGVRDSRVML